MQTSIIDIYEFKLSSYEEVSNPNENDLEKFKFNFPKKTNLNECGLIQTINEESNNDDNINDVRSCDLIKSDSNKSVYDESLRSAYDEINNPTSINFISKDDSNQIVYRFSKLKLYFDHVYVNCNPKYNLVQLESISVCIPPDNFLLNYSELLIKTMKKLQLVYEFTPTNFNPSFIYKLHIKLFHKIICIGDIHGGFHTFYRLLQRFEIMGILDLETFTINEPYKIIFTGDILDRGVYSLEILDILLKFIVINSNEDSIKIIYNRGNHEDYRIFKRDGFKRELEIKFKNLYKNPNNHHFDFGTFIKNIINFFTYLPCAVIICCDSVNKSYFIAHGGFSVDKDKDYAPDVYDFENNNICLLTSEQTEQIMWNDFTSIKNNYHNERRGRNMINLTKVELDKFLKLNSIDFIVRAHQDSYGNSFLFEESLNDDLDENKITIRDNLQRLSELFTNNNNFILNTKPIAQLDINKFDKNNRLLRVLTISTNTAYKRKLSYDSFIIINF
jgi:hypothetical protein